ncbi:centrosomal protein of 57 kDa isoform X2 [Python bivittatus]|uniref:Centrosomal protein of 57 kDa isoform X2 n=1 Tax=Python bivittatus TaxID=176946 RepID=A0A9F5J8E7_PYTBI|nr:centrosomal protein of 57 kDa isoform X2 [Python bivittatus]
MQMIPFQKMPRPYFLNGPAGQRVPLRLEQRFSTLGTLRCVDFHSQSIQGVLRASHRSTSFTDGLSAASFSEYPRHKPFVNADLHRSPAKPVNVYPESNSKAIFSALKNLQEKIRRLELERIQAEENVKSLTRETSDYKKVLSEQLLEREQSKLQVSRKNDELAAQLAGAETRCSLLEKQLEYMKEMIAQAEREKTTVLEKQATLERERIVDHSHVKSKLERLDLLEKEYTRLTAMQSLAEKKMKELEEKLQEEERARKLVQEKAAELQTGLETNRRLLKAQTQPAPVLMPSKSKKMKKKPKQLEKNDLGMTHVHAQPHYRLRLGDVPFVAGKSTSPSHSVTANVQHVLHLMKHHSKALCNDRVVSEVLMSKQMNKGRRSSASSISSTSQGDLSEVLLTLQDELGQMSFEHQHLAKLIHEASTIALRGDLERELEALVKRMEAKAEQINKIQRHRARMYLDWRVMEIILNSWRTPFKKAGEAQGGQQDQAALQPGSLQRGRREDSAGNWQGERGRSEEEAG